jgi:CMP-N,N'-diacetyllegionaminic acid synthase
MINGKKVLVILPARGGSKGLPGKNGRPLQGRPLLAWTIDAAKGSRFVDKVLLSSDSQELIEIAKRFGADAPFVRPESLSGDLAKQEDAILHAMAWVESTEGAYDYIMMLTATNPLRTAADIDAAVERMVAEPRARAVMTVIECEHSPLFANVLPPDGNMDNFVPEEYRLKNRQELPKYYRICGSVCLSEWEHFKKHRSFVTPETYALVTSARSGLDIDGLGDFMLAETYLKNPELR